MAPILRRPDESNQSPEREREREQSQTLQGPQVLEHEPPPPASDGYPETEDPPP